MIARILQCDGCYASTTVGAKPTTSGGEARKARNAGSIRRVRLGVIRYGNRARPVSVDLCGFCRDNGKADEMRQRREAAPVLYEGMTWESQR